MRIAAAGLLTGAALLVACGSSSDITDPPDNGAQGVQSVRVTPSVPRLELPGQTLTLRANARDGSGTNVPGLGFTWRSSDPSIATVDADGLVTAVAIGSATISATASGVTGSVTLEVTGIRSLSFLAGDWAVDTGDGATTDAESSWGSLLAGIFEEVRTRDGTELVRVLTRVEPAIEISQL